MSGPLTGYRVIDFTQLLPGPLTSRYLADLGAEVIKLEDVAGSDLIRIVPPYDNGISSSHIAINRNKKSIALNLKSPSGQEILHRLVETCDILVESYRPGTATRLGADYETLRKVNSRLVYCSISGYGQTGPYKLRPGHDINYESYCGFLGLTGESVDKPPSLPAVPVADIAGGSLNAVIAILAAIIAREKTGKGQYIDLSMLDGLLSLMVTLYPAYFADRNLPERGKGKLSWTAIALQDKISVDFDEAIKALEPDYPAEDSFVLKVVTEGQSYQDIYKQIALRIDRAFKGKEKNH